MLLRFDGPSTVHEDGRLRTQRLRGEVHLELATALDGGDTPVQLRRLGLYSLDTPAGVRSGEISVGATSAEGWIAPEGAENRYSLKVSFTAQTTYDALRPARDEPSEPLPGADVEPAQFVELTGLVSLRFAVVEDAPPTRRFQVVSGELNLDGGEDPGGPLQAIQIRMEGNLHFFPLDWTPVLVLPLRPVIFPLDANSCTGSTWQHQLDQANLVWGECCIRFAGQEFKPIDDTTLAHTSKQFPIRQSWREEGIIEVFLIHAGHQMASTSEAGTALSQVILPEVADFNLLAHELGHVLGGCHPDRSYCDSSLWVADGNTILEYGNPIPHGNNSVGNCDRARSHPQPLLTTSIEACDLNR